MLGNRGNNGKVPSSLERKTMLEALRKILEIQELDMKMIRLMRLKEQRQKELKHIASIKQDLVDQKEGKESEVLNLKKEIRLAEGEVEEIRQKIKRLEGKQTSVKKVEEFAALSQELGATERARTSAEQRLSDLEEKLTEEAGVLDTIQESLVSTIESSRDLEAEICDSIRKINDEGRSIKAERETTVTDADPEIFRIYERLMRNKKDRVVVPIENRTCGGCHIVLTAQHENVVRKGERLIFCEYCSRIHYWQKAEALQGTTVATKKRRRRSTTATTTKAKT